MLISPAALLKSLAVACSAIVLVVLAGCAGTSAGGERTGSGIEVFGTIDTSISRTTTKSAR
ncbi:MAG: hypothetical protein EOP81_17635 [Variovorax sp.]|nr:MAG: hypothetical protein EOP81_17635 [Variovorax sp.]